jgi:hypothetical protein
MRRFSQSERRSRVHRSTAKNSSSSQFDGPVQQTEVDLVESKTYPNGFVFQRYRVRR